MVNERVMVSVTGDASVEDKTALLEAMDFKALGDVLPAGKHRRRRRTCPGVSQTAEDGESSDEDERRGEEDGARGLGLAAGVHAGEDVAVDAGRHGGGHHRRAHEALRQAEDALGEEVGDRRVQRSSESAAIMPASASEARIE